MSTAKEPTAATREESPFPFLAPTSFMDDYKAPLNACSIETTPDPVEIVERDGSVDHVWPVALSCYELQADGSRRGHMDVFLVKTPSVEEETEEGLEPSLSALQFGKPLTVHSSENTHSPGILDGKWHDSSSDSKKTTWYYATALSTGQIGLDRFDFHSAQETEIGSADEPKSQPPKKSPFQVSRAGQSDISEETNHLCLALSWDPSHESSDKSRIVSTYSDGKVAIHEVAFLETSTQLVERDSWLAHTSFVGDAPAEVWCACFVGNQAGEKLIMSGGDDAKLKLWDVRSTNRPVQVLQTFDAGVTVVSPDPRREYFVACGSYDETVALYDVRDGSPKPLARSKQMGGGIWRIQWHPHEDQRLLLACMHGGCSVVNVDLASDQEFNETRKFTQHESMAYGAAWLVCRHPVPKREEYYSAAVSCSFYDKMAFLWSPVRSNPQEI